MKIKIYPRDKKQIRERFAKWMTYEQIQKSFPKKHIPILIITDIVKKFNKLEWNKIEWITYLKCNKCENIKPYTYEYFQITEKSKEKKCRYCRNLERRNKRILKNNMWIKNVKDLHQSRRWWRYKLMRIIDINYYKWIKIPKKLQEWKKDT